MGLDSVELVMKVEKTFDINIPDEEAEQIRTVGDFHDAVWRHLFARHSDKCKSQILFYRLRSSLADLFSLSPRELQLNTVPEEIFPKSSRRQKYFNFAKATNLTLPALSLSQPWSNLLIWFGSSTIIGGLVLSLLLINILNVTQWTLLFPVAGICLTILFSKLLEPKRTIISAPTLRSFTEQTLVLNYANLVTSVGTNRREMEMVINHLIADVTGVEIEEITPEKKIVDDLGID